MSTSLNDREREAIEIVKAAIKALPQGIQLYIFDENTMFFYKPKPTEKIWKTVGKLISKGRFLD